MDGVFTDTVFFEVVLLPFLIFLARIFDVSIGTLRVIFVARGMRMIAPLLGFFEVLVWVVAIGQIIQNMDAWYYYVAYAGGFASGTWVGMWIESKLAIGVVSLRVVTQVDASELVRELRSRDYGVTSIDAEGATGPVKVLYMLITRHSLSEVINLVKKFNPHAFYSVEDTRFVKQGVFPRRDEHKLHIPRRIRNGHAKKK
jgi:uncharacterized protein YebE (UPF0316 family)